MQEPPPTLETQLIRAWLAEHDDPCPVCGYNLRAITSSACPECGARLDLRVGSVDLRLGPWLVAILGVALPLGFVGIYTAYAGIAFVFAGFGRGSLAWFLVPLFISAGYALMLARLIRQRRKFWRKSPRAQCIAAAVYATVGPGLFVGVPLILWALAMLLG